MFFTFRQNNSGGSFHYDEDDGISHHVVVEADSNNEACKIAETIGIYFNGVDEGRDCDCCGDRWCEPYDGGEPEPTIYGVSIDEYMNKKYNGREFFKKDQKLIFVHYKNGVVQGY